MKNFFTTLILITFFALPSYSKVNKNKSGVALDGYDIVAYFNKGQKEAVKGNKDFKEVHNQTTYYFSSKDNLVKFQKEPNKYLPAYGGYCAWAIEESSEYVPVDYDSFLISKDENGADRLLLFYNKFFINTKKKWSKKSKKIKDGEKSLIKIADKNWVELTSK